MPFFSVIIPTYNRARLIGQTIESVVNQTFQDFEILVIDDGSTDNTKEVVEKMEKTLDRVHYFKKRNEERGVARNFGIKKSIGKYLVFLDSDDLMFPNHLSVLFENIQNSQADFIATKFSFLIHDGTIKKSALMTLPSGYYNYKLFLKGNCIACNLCVKNRKDLIFFETDRRFASMEDWIFNLENLINNELLLIDKVTIYMRIHDGRSMNNNKEIIQKRLRANEMLLDRLPLTKKEQKQMSGYSYYFCAIHAYLDGLKFKGLIYIYQAIKSAGLSSKFILMILKLLVGYRMVQRVK